MSYILRHGAQKEGLIIQEDGFMDVDHLLSHKSFKGITCDDIRHIVISDEKQRYRLEEGSNGQLRIRANQGHSIKVNVSMKVITNPEEIAVAIHGTNAKAWTSIQSEGLKVMSRQHIHLASGRHGEEGVISGMRKSCSVFIYIDVAQAMKDGIEFFVSDNGVILTTGMNGVIHPRYFAKVEDDSGKCLMGKTIN